METILVEKKVFENFVLDLERLLVNFEKMVDTTLELEAANRLSDLKNNKVSGFTENDYKKLVKKMGIANA